MACKIIRSTHGQRHHRGSGKRGQITRSFTLYVGGDEVYDRDKADALEAALKPLVGGPLVTKMFRYDTDTAHNPQPPQRGQR
jgi:hypothetical protein